MCIGMEYMSMLQNEDSAWITQTFTVWRWRYISHFSVTHRSLSSNIHGTFLSLFLWSSALRSLCIHHQCGGILFVQPSSVKIPTAIKCWRSRWCRCDASSSLLILTLSSTALHSTANSSALQKRFQIKRRTQRYFLLGAIQRGLFIEKCSSLNHIEFFLWNAAPNFSWVSPQEDLLHSL